MTTETKRTLEQIDRRLDSLFAGFGPDLPLIRTLIHEAHALGLAEGRAGAGAMRAALEEADAGLGFAPCGCNEHGGFRCSPCKARDAVRAALRSPPPEDTGPAADRMVTWGVSLDEEHFFGHFTTKEEAIAGAAAELGLEPGQPFWIGGGARYDAARAIDALQILERLGEDAYEECGDVAEDWPDMRPGDARRALTDEIRAAITRYLRAVDDLPRFYACEFTEKHTAPAAGKDGG